MYGYGDEKECRSVRADTTTSPRPRPGRGESSRCLSKWTGAFASRLPTALAATATAVAAATAAVAAAAAPAAAAFGLGTRFVDGERTAIDLLEVEGVDGGLS